MSKLAHGLAPTFFFFLIKSTGAFKSLTVPLLKRGHCSLATAGTRWCIWGRLGEHGREEGRDNEWALRASWFPLGISKACWESQTPAVSEKETPRWCSLFLKRSSENNGVLSKVLNHRPWSFCVAVMSQWHSFENIFIMRLVCLW